MSVHDTAYVGRQYMNILFSRVVSRGPLSQINRESFSEHSAETAIPEKPWSFLTHVGSGLDFGALLLLF